MFIILIIAVIAIGATANFEGSVAAIVFLIILEALIICEYIIVFFQVAVDNISITSRFEHLLVGCRTLV